MSRDKVHFLHIEKRPAEAGPRRGVRIPGDLLFLLALGVAFVLAHYSDKPPLVERPISLQRADAPRIAEPAGTGVNLLDNGLRGFER